MDGDHVTIRRVSIENFRGFRTEQTIDLAASATIVSGSNGKGKTSFFDALQWLLLGSLSRLANLASRRSGNYVVNGFAGPTALAKVTAELELGGRSVTLTRTGDHKIAPLQWTDEDRILTNGDADRALCAALLGDPEMSLHDTVLTSAILEQDVVRAVLEDEPKNRYRHLAALLGLEDIAGFEDEAKHQAEDRGKLATRARDEHAAAEHQLRSADTDLARLEQRLATQPEIAQARSQLESRLLETGISFDIGELPTQAAGAVSLGQLARRTRIAADALLSEDVKLREQEANLPTADAKQLAVVQARVEETEQERSEADAAHERALEEQRDAEQRASQLAELATLAIPLLGENCPVCQQRISPADIEAHLRELIEGGGEDLPAMGRATAEARQQVVAIDDAIERLQIQLHEQQLALKRIQDVAAARQSWRQECEQLASSGAPLRSAVQQALVAGRIEALTELRSSADQLASIADELASLLGTSGLAEEVERQRDQVKTLREAVHELSDNAARASRQAEEAKTLAGAATRAIAGVTRDRFASLQPLVDDIFARLAPHPAFTTMGFEMGVSYRSGIADPFVTDPESGVTGDPLLVFSSSQANVAALTYFLALSWAADAKAVPFLLLDDPLQSMDDVNALGFSDLCRHVRRRRQLVVSTHEERLAGLLERKLAPRSPQQRTRILRFTGWDRDGPTIEQADVEPEFVGDLLESTQ
jgi:DNA repair exonuclease SbcCD ATPase subunit